MTYTAPMPVPPFARPARPTENELRSRGLLEAEVAYLRTSPPEPASVAVSRKCGRWCIASATLMLLFLWAFCIKGLLLPWQAVLFGVLGLFMVFRLHRDWRVGQAERMTARK